MKKSLLFLASMLLMIPAMVSAATCNVQLKFNPGEMSDWNDLTKGVYLYDFEGNFTKMGPVDSLNVNPDTLYYSADTEATTFCFTYGECESKKVADEYFSGYPMYRSGDVVLEEGTTFAVFRMKPGKCEDDEITDWYTVVTLTESVVAPKFVSEPNPDGNLLDDDSYNFNKGKAGVWESVGENDAKPTAVARGVNASEFCLYVVNDKDNENDYATQICAWSQKVIGKDSYIPGHKYAISYYARTNRGKGKVTPQFQQHTDPWAGASGKEVELTTKWTQYLDTITIPTKAQVFDWATFSNKDVDVDNVDRFMFNVGKVKADIYFDRIYLQDLDLPVDEPNLKENMLDDASYNFNDGTVGGWHFLGWNNSGTATNFKPGYAQSAGCMELTSKNPNGDAWGAQLLCSLKEGAKLEIGKTYIVSFWAKGTVEGDYFSPGAGAYPSPEWNNAEPAKLTTEWQKYEYTLVCTEANTAAEGNTQIYFNHGKLTGKAYVDRISVVPFVAPKEENPSDNMLDDASYNFNDGTVGGWHFLGWNNSGTATNFKPGYEQSAGCMELTSKNPDGDAWGAQLLCSLKEGAKLEIGKTYIVSFWAKGTVAGDYFSPGAGAYPSPEWNNAAPAVLTTEWQQYTYTLVCTEANTAAAGNTQIYFNHGKLTGKAYVDRIVVAPFKYTEEPNEYGNILDEVSYNFNDGTIGNWKMSQWNNNGGKATAANSKDGFDGSAGSMVLSNTAEAGNNYEAQLPVKFDVIKPGFYTIMFYAKAEKEGSKIEFGMQIDPWNQSNPEVSGNEFTLTTEWKQYMTTVEVPKEGFNTAYFNFGKTVDKIYLDRIALVDGAEELAAEEPSEPEEPEEPEEPKDFYLKNVSTGKYLAVNVTGNSNIGLSDEASKQIVKVVANGDLLTTTIELDGTSYFLSAGTGFNFKSGNAGGSNQNSGYWYEVTESDDMLITATKVAEVVPGKDYIIFQNYQGWMALSGSLVDAEKPNNKWRLEGVKIEEELEDTLSLPADKYSSCIYYYGADVPTLVPTVFEAENNDVIYNTLGQRVNAPVKGINIINGQKVLF